MANPNPNTAGLKPFPKGKSGNPGGKTAAQRRLEIENAEMATKLANEALRAKLEKVEAGEIAADELDANTIRMIKDAQDRGLGQPQQALDLTTDGDRFYRPIDEMTVAEMEAELAELSKGDD